MLEPIWIEKQETLLAHLRQLSEHGGAEGVRDEGLLESALARPRNVYLYEADADVFHLAAAYAFGISRNHPFLDGNKRMALVVAEAFLYINGFRIVSPIEEKYLMYLWLSEGNFSESEMANWMREKAVAL